MRLTVTLADGTSAEIDDPNGSYTPEVIRDWASTLVGILKTAPERQPAPATVIYEGEYPDDDEDAGE